MAGRSFGPMTSNATTPTTTSSQKPISNMGLPKHQQSLCFFFGLGDCFAVDYAMGVTLLDFVSTAFGGGFRLSLAVTHSATEAFHRTAKITADAAQLFCAEQHDNDE